MFFSSGEGKSFRDVSFSFDSDYTLKGTDDATVG